MRIVRAGLANTPKEGAHDRFHGKCVSADVADVHTTINWVKDVIFSWMSPQIIEIIRLATIGNLGRGCGV